jgi:preprotein translocase subunit SecG
MTILFLILILLATVILGFIILVQNPKGGGLSGNIAGFSNQFMGVKQTTDVLEKGTWIFAAAIAILCLLSPIFMKSGSSTNDNNLLNKVNTNQSTSAPMQQPTPAQPGNAVPVQPAK